MDVRMPNGTVIKNVPDDYSQDQVMQSLHSAGYDTTALSTPAPTSASKQASPENWSMGDYGRAAWRGITNLPKDIGQLYGEGLQLGGQLAGAAMHPIETAKKIGRAAEAQAKTVGGEVLLGAEALGLPIKPKPGKEKEAAEVINAAKSLNAQISSSALGEAARGNFGPLIDSIANRPAHAALNAAIGLKSLAGLAEKAGYDALAVNLTKGASALDPFALPGKVGQATRTAAGATGEFVGGTPGKVLNWYSQTPTLGEFGTNLLGKAVRSGTQWGQDIFHPEQMWLRKTYGEDIGAARKMLEAAPEVSETGARLTPAERTLGLGRVEAPAGEAELGRTKAATMSDRMERARKEKLGRQVSPLVQDTAELEAERTAASEANYAKSDKVQVTSDATLESLLDRASAAVKKAEEAAGIEGRPFSSVIDKRSEVERAYSSGGAPTTAETKVAGGKVSPTVTDVKFERDPITGQLKTTAGYNPVTGERVGVPAGTTTSATETRKIGGGVSPATGAKQYSGKTLAEIDRALGDLASLPQGAEGMTKTISSHLRNLRTELRSYLFKEGKAPELKQAIETHASQSRGIERSKIAGYVQNLVSDINNPAGEKQFLEYWKEARKGDASRLIKDATGNTEYTSLGEKGAGFTPGEIRRFDKIAKDLERRQEYMRQAAKGAGADIGVGEGAKTIPHTLNEPGMWANMLLRFKGQALTKKAANNLAKVVFESGNEETIAAFDRAIKSGKQPDINKAYVMAKAAEANALLKKGQKAYSTIEAQAVRGFLNPNNNVNQNSLAQ